MAQVFKGRILNTEHFPMPGPARERGESFMGLERRPEARSAEVRQATAELEQLQQHIASMRAEIEQMAQTMHEQAQQRGHEEGLVRGQSEVQHHVMEAMAMLTEAQRERAALARENSTALADLALKIARRVIDVELQSDTETIARIVEHTIRELEPSASLVVRVNPQDLPAVQQRSDELAKLAGGQVQLIADDTVDRGGCMLSSPVGDVDARISTKLEVLETAFTAQRRQNGEGA